MTATIDVLVPVHSPDRPIGRLAASVLGSTRAMVRLLVVAHNTPVDGVAEALGAHVDDSRVELAHLSDGIPSPAGPLRHALGHVTAPFFTKIDSDDRLVDGAIDSWLATQRKYDAAIVLPVMTMEGAPGAFPTPPSRPGRRLLDPVRDRLAYRTSTMGLIRSDLAPLAVPTAGLETGEDIAPSLRLWFHGGPVAAADARARYLVGSDAGDRVTASRRSLARELAFVDPLREEALWNGVSADARASIAVKLLRVHVFGAARRGAVHGYLAEDLGALTHASRVLAELAPGAWRVLSRIDRDLAEELSAATPDADRVSRLTLRRTRYASPAALTTRSLRDSLRRDAPIRFLTASVLARRRG